MKKQETNEPKLRDAFREGFKQENFFQTVKREFSELQEFYLDENRRQRLREMGVLKRTFWTIVWLLKLMFLRLSPIRRLLMLGGLILMFTWTRLSNAENDSPFGPNTLLLGTIIILFILMLELKDKLLARDELEAGRKVQIALMPERSPSVPGWDIWLYSRPANDVGGDLIDFFEISENKYGIVLGDVSGKGLEAALFMAKLQATIRAFLTEFSSLAEFAAKINKIFHRDSLPNKFASMVFTELEANTGHVRLIDAGHMPPIVLRKDGMEEIESKTPAFGLMSNAQYMEKQLEFEQGDFLILYSDGISEARSENGEFYGEDRLKEKIKKTKTSSARNLGESIIKDIARFKREARIFDDLSLAIIRRV